MSSSGSSPAVSSRRLASLPTSGARASCYRKQKRRRGSRSTTPINLAIAGIPRASARCRLRKSLAICQSEVRVDISRLADRVVTDPIDKPALPSRRRPLSFTWAGRSRKIEDLPSTLAGPCDAISDTCDAEDRLRRRLLLLLRRLLHCFRFFLLRHSYPPSLSGWR